MKTLKSDDMPIQNDLLHSKERANPVTPAVTLKGSVFTLPVIKLSTFDILQIREGLSAHLSSAKDFFRHAPVIVDLSGTHDSENNLNFVDLSDLLKSFDLVCVGVQHGTKEQHASASAYGLGVLSGQLKIHPKYPQVPDPVSTDRDTVIESQSSPRSAHTTVSENTDTPNARPTKVVSSPIRSGQRVYAKGGDLILLAAVNAGAEIMADGNIHIYAPLRGRALAGVSGDLSARIFCHSLEAELVAIAGGYRVFEDVIPEEIYKKSVQIYLDGEQLKIEDID